MSKLIYRVENAPGRIYGKNSDELVFKEPTRDAVIYSTSTKSGWLKNTRKHLWRGLPSEKEGGICIATIDEPIHATLAVHPARTSETEDSTDTTSDTTRLKLKTTWFGSNSRTVTFSGVTYTWTGTSKITDKDGNVVARMTKPWFFQGKLGDLEIDIEHDDENGRQVLEMVLATYVQRWWEEKVKAEKAKEEAKEQKTREKKAAQATQTAAESQKEVEKKEGNDNTDGQGD
ncbi:hypothetical protein VM1G_01207 [Cytospora mali]|uniref:Uncharacterized protein n=1 Tax=Cytospora mali TaxID=578113 RepID=A0A194VL54_CYTMA|nr:hypothetical protein VM1G_01207 [Valsa mali]